MKNEILTLAKNGKFFFKIDEEYNETLFCFYLEEVKHEYFLSINKNKKKEVKNISRNIRFIEDDEDINIISSVEEMNFLSNEEIGELIFLWLESCPCNCSYEHFAGLLHTLYKTL